MRPRSTTLALTFVLSSAALAACGPPPPAVGPENGTPTAPTGVTAPTAAPGVSATPTAGPTASPPVAPAGKPNTPVQHSKLVEDAKKLGIDFKKVPDIEKIPLDQKKKLMPLFVKALGYESCNGCHAEGGDFKKETHNLKVARGMWNHFVKTMRDDAGNAVFCDSCHSGQQKILNREDKTALKKFMETDYEDKLTRADKKENGCATCHGDAMETKIIEKLWGVASK